MEFTTMFSQNAKQLTVLVNLKFKFKYEAKISGNVIKHAKLNLSSTRIKLYYKKNQFLQLNIKP